MDEPESGAGTDPVVLVVGERGACGPVDWCTATSSRREVTAVDQPCGLCMVFSPLRSGIPSKRFLDSQFGTIHVIALATVRSSLTEE